MNVARGGEARTHVEVEEQRHEAAKRQCDKDPFDGEVPEGNDPVAIESWVEGRGDGEELDVRVLDVAGAVEQGKVSERDTVKGEKATHICTKPV